jgi:GWxTD domain-containing protein
MRAILVVVSVLFTLSPAGAESLDRDLAQARKHIADGKLKPAVEILEAALPKVDTLPADVQTQAATAMHFYAAVALSGLAREDEALIHLREAFRLSPNMSSIDSKKYDQRFVSLFDQVRSGIAGRDTFASLYPGFNSNEIMPAAGDPSTWGTSPALELLGSKVEKREWNDLTSAADRERFITEFWQVRDSSPDTPGNEFRQAFEQRAAFANTIFSSSGTVGALTDRGRVFALLGEPEMVLRRSVNAGDTMTVMNVGSRGIEVGNIEYWFYRREQLPSSFGKPNITFRFVSHQGIGNYVLQKDGLVMSALSMATKPAGVE